MDVGPLIYSVFSLNWVNVNPMETSSERSEATTPFRQQDSARPNAVKVTLSGVN